MASSRPLRSSGSNFTPIRKSTLRSNTSRPLSTTPGARNCASGHGARKPGVLLFVHGYNVSFEDAARRTGQLAYDLGFEGPTVFFSWPSRGSVTAYTRRADRAVGHPDLKSVLSDLAVLLRRAGICDRA